MLLLFTLIYNLNLGSSIFKESSLRGLRNLLHHLFFHVCLL